MLSTFDKFLIIFSILSICIGIAIIICYFIHTKIDDRRLEDARRFCIQLEKIKAERKPCDSEETIPIEIFEQVQQIRKEFDSALDGLENLIIKENVRCYLER